MEDTTSIQEHSIDLRKILQLTQELSLLDKVRLVERMMPQIEHELASAAKMPKKSLLGICSDLGPAPSSETIDKVRREVWQIFPRGWLMLRAIADTHAVIWYIFNDKRLSDVARLAIESAASQHLASLSSGEVLSVLR